MSYCVSAAETIVEISKKNILDQRLRIERQRALIPRLERDASFDLVDDAVRVLGEMERVLAQMEAHYAATHEHLVKAH